MKLGLGGVESLKQIALKGGLSLKVCKPRCWAASHEIGRELRVRDGKRYICGRITALSMRRQLLLFFVIESYGSLHVTDQGNTNVFIGIL